MRARKSQRTNGASRTAQLFCGDSCVSSRIRPACRHLAFWLLWRTAVALLALLLVGGSTWGQATTSVRGPVVDPSGKALPMSSVVLSNFGSTTRRLTITGGQGEYQL